ncbi:hypothetical protein R1flu_019736 [Riccia fluitans]|uniref:Uncharacterized protein n=1 Tax=Riccia fluitans TaxID=41844 RepID=A0ABD1ZJI6_9MARC
MGDSSAGVCLAAWARRGKGTGNASRNRHSVAGRGVGGAHGRQPPPGEWARQEAFFTSMASAVPYDEEGGGRSFPKKLWRRGLGELLREADALEVALPLRRKGSESLDRF